MTLKRFISLMLVLCLCSAMALAETAAAAVQIPLPAETAETENVVLPEASPEAESSILPEPTPVLSPAEPTEEAIEASVEPTPEPAAGPSIEAAVEPTVVPSVESSPEPTAEIAAEPTPEPSPEPAAEPTTEPSVEPTPAPLPQSISLPETLLIGYKETVEGALVPEIEPSGCAYSLTYSSSKTRYVQVDETTGTLYGARTGSAVITVTTDNGLSASCKVTVKKAPGKVKLKAGTGVLAAGESTALSVSFNSSSAYSHSISYSSSDESVARVEGGRVIAVAPGSAKITAASFNGKKGSITITVLHEPESVHFTSLPEKLGVGQSAQLSAAVNEDSRGEIRFSGNDESIAAVNPDGSITALAEGILTVTATAYNGVSASADIRIIPAPASLAFAEETIYIGEDEVLTDALQLIMDEGSAADIRFSSSSTRYVKVDAASGKITGERRGKAVITAETHNGLRAECTVVVEKAPSKVRLSVASKTMGAGQSQPLSISITGRGHYAVKSSKPEIVAVDESGMLHALSEGKAKITVTTYNKRSASVSITVSPAPSEIRAAAESISLGAGESARLSFSVNKGSHAAFSYESSHPEIAEVDASGKVSALAAGTSVITATTQNGLSASTTVEVLSDPEAILFEGERLTIAVGERRAILFSTLPEKVKTSYSYRTDNTSIVRIDQKGVLSGYGRGETTVAITASNGVSAEITVEVVGYSELNDPYVMAHRGASGYYPDNSIAAFEHAAELGADMVELDVRKTKDGKLVVFHDYLIEINGRERKIADLKLSDIRKANPDVCTLEEALACIAGTDMEVMIEFKVSGIEKSVVNCVKNAGIADRALYGSFKLDVIKKIKSLLPGARTIYIMQEEDVLEDVLEDIEDYSFNTASIRYDLLSEKIVRDLHLAGKQVVGWTLNLLSEIRDAISMGVDGVTTDYPDRVR